MLHNYKRKSVARLFEDFMDENLKKAVKACRDEGLSIRDASDLHGVERGTQYNALKGKYQNVPGGMTVFSQRGVSICQTFDGS